MRDAAEVLPRECIFRHDNGSLAPFADWFRYTWLERAGGFWTDMDVACLSSDFPEKLPWFAEQEQGLIAVGVIGFPPHHPMIKCLKDVSADPAAPMPWDDVNELAAKRQFKLDSPDVKLRRQRAMWGNAGPEGFTRAVAHFQLLDLAEPTESIYPLHYTVWRNCYNGAIALDSPELKNSWAIHLWGELLRREPDALENVNKESIVGQLMDMYMPCTYPISQSKKRVSILVGVCTCVHAEKRRQAVRDTWMKHRVPGIECQFFLGRRDVLVQEPDVIPLWVNDDYDHLPEKVFAFFQYALDHYDFDWLFKCDDDTYIALERLSELADEAYDLIGDLSLGVRGTPSGGAGYFLSRSLVEKIVALSDIPRTGAEDLIFGALALSLGAKTLSSHRLNLNPTPYPMKENDLITAHWCPPEYLYAIEDFNTSLPVTVYEGVHAHWSDSLLFYRDGRFRRKQSACAGRWVLNGSQGLILQWFSWSPESLIREGDDYLGSSLRLTRGDNQPDLISALFPEMSELGSEKAASELLLIQMGHSTNVLDGWINLDLSRHDITQPLALDDKSVDAFFLDHVIEHVLPAEAYGFCMEAWRALKPGGVLRLAFSDLLRIAKGATPEYLQFLKEHGWGDGSVGSSIRNIIENHGHKAVWTLETMSVMLQSIGYEVTPCSTGESRHSHLRGLESHASQRGSVFNNVETSCLEAMKPYVLS